MLDPIGERDNGKLPDDYPLGPLCATMTEKRQVLGWMDKQAALFNVSPQELKTEFSHYIVRQSDSVYGMGWIYKDTNTATMCNFGRARRRSGAESARNARRRPRRGRPETASIPAGDGLAASRWRPHDRPDTVSPPAGHGHTTGRERPGTQAIPD